MLMFHHRHCLAAFVSIVVVVADVVPGLSLESSSSKDPEQKEGDFRLRGVRGVQDADSKGEPVHRRLFFESLVDLMVEVTKNELVPEDDPPFINTGEYANGNREDFTVGAVNECRQAFPNYNCVITKWNDHEVQGDYNVLRLDVMIKSHFFQRYGYRLYWSKSGSPFYLNRWGDGGSINWQYSGEYVRETPGSIRAIEYSDTSQSLGTWHVEIGYCDWGPLGTAASSICEGGGGGGEWCDASRENCDLGCGGRWCMGIGPEVPRLPPLGGGESGVGFCNWGPLGTAASSTCEGGAQGGDWCNASSDNCMSGCGGKWCM